MGVSFTSDNYAAGFIGLVLASLALAWFLGARLLKEHPAGVASLASDKKAGSANPAVHPISTPVSHNYEPGKPANFSDNVAPKSQPFSDSGPVKGMALRLKRGERAGAFGRVIFTLDARIDVSEENRALIIKYNLGSRVIYESANREKYREKTRQHAENSRDTPGFRASSEQQFFGIGKTLFRLGAAAVTATVSALSLRITVNSLMSGVHIECKDMGELLEAEDAIKLAGRNLKDEIETATSFTGQEQVIDL